MWIVAEAWSATTDDTKKIGFRTLVGPNERVSEQALVFRRPFCFFLLQLFDHVVIFKAALTDFISTECASAVESTIRKGDTADTALPLTHDLLHSKLSLLINGQP